MSREIKFRAWDKTFNKMVEVTDLNLDNRSLIGYMGDRLVSCKFDDCELMQYTGLKDKNGVEIHKGDICIMRGEEPMYNEQISTDYDWKLSGVIKFLDFACWLVRKDGTDIFLGEEFDEIEVIGNIYENPELLEVKQ